MDTKERIFVITGSNGFSAHYLCKYIKEINPLSLCYGIDVNPKSFNPLINYYYSTSEYGKFEHDLISAESPMKFFHLAGLIGNHRLHRLIEANVLWTSRYIELFSDLKHPDCFINIGSSAEYGLQQAKVLTENLIPNPVNS